MRIVNVALNGIYTDGFSYHENLLPLYHKKNGHDVTILTSEFEFNSDGVPVKTSRCDYIDENGIHIIRLPIKNGKDISYRLKRFEGVYQALEKLNPEIIFCHLFQFVDVNEVIRYKKNHPGIKLFIDSHSDYSNSAKSWLSKNIQHKILWRYFAQKALPYTERFYGVLPARVDFIKELYHIPDNKVELLVMGADDELVAQAATKDSIALVRNRYGIDYDDFLIVTGGKIDLWKKQTLLLMDAVNSISNSKLKLIVFGSVVDELKEEINRRCTEKVKYIGWLESKDSYPVFGAGDLAVFPGRHSVFWEQVAGQGIPLVIKYWEGTDDVNQNGNVCFLNKDSVEEIKETIENLITNKDRFEDMRKIAQSKAYLFSYKYLAKKSIDEDCTGEKK